MGLLEELKESRFPYSPTIARDLIKANRQKCGKVQPRTKRILFFMVKKLVLRNISAYMNILRNRGLEGSYEEEDVMEELFMVLDRCADLYKVEIHKDFYLYFNTSANRRVRRMADYKMINNSEVNLTNYRAAVDDNEEDPDGDEEAQVFHDEPSTNAGLFWDYVDNSLDEEERKMVHAINTHAKLNDRMKALGVGRKEYYHILERLREKLKNNGYYAESDDE